MHVDMSVVQAFAKGMVSASVCGKCSVAAEFVAESWETILLKAIADAEIELIGSGNTSLSADIFVEAVEKATVTAFAEVRALPTRPGLLSVANRPNATTGPLGYR